MGRGIFRHSPDSRGAPGDIWVTPNQSCPCSLIKALNRSYNDLPTLVTDPKKTHQGLLPLPMLGPRTTQGKEIEGKTEDSAVNN